MRSLIIVLLLVAWSSMAEADGAAERLVGTWLLERIENRSEAGAWVQAETRLGIDPVGLIMYDPVGNMAVQIMRSGRPPLSLEGAGDRANPEDALALAPVEQRARAFDGYTAYFGRYTVRADDGIVVHHREGHLVPNRSGSDVERAFAFVDDTLVLTVAGRSRLVWRRAR